MAPCQIVLRNELILFENSLEKNRDSISETLSIESSEYLMI